MLGVLAMKKRWQNKRKAEGKPFDRPNMIMNSAVQVCWEKAARYFDVEEKVRPWHMHKVYWQGTSLTYFSTSTARKNDGSLIQRSVLTWLTKTQLVSALSLVQLTLENTRMSRLSTIFSLNVISTLESTVIFPGTGNEILANHCYSRRCIRWICCSFRLPRTGVGFPSAKGRLHQRLRSQIRTCLPWCRLGRMA